MYNKKLNIKRAMTYAGAFVAFLIGSGFATGQEVLQYFASYGYMGIAGVFAAFILMLFAGISFISAGQENKFEKGGDVFKYYCGNALGTFLNYFSVLFMYLSFMVMIAGAGATFNQYYNLPVFVGGFIMASLACATVLLGLGRIVEIIGRMGPAIVIMTVLIGLITIFRNTDGLMEAEKAMSALALTKASTNWFFAAGSYVGFCMLWLAGVLSSMGAKAESKKEAVWGAAIGAVSFCFGLLIITSGLLSCIEEVNGSQIPLLILAEKIHPLMAAAISIIIIMGIFTTAVPLLWSVSSVFANDKSLKFKLLTVILSIIGLFVGICIPFSKLVNVVYVINGYVGIVLLVMMIIKASANHIRNKGLPATPDAR